jgi:hypothetical protein
MTNIYPPKNYDLEDCQLKKASGINPKQKNHSKKENTPNHSWSRWYSAAEGRRETKRHSIQHL